MSRKKFNEKFDDSNVKNGSIKIVKETTVLAKDMKTLNKIKEIVYPQNEADIKRDNVLEFILDNNHE